MVFVKPKVIIITGPTASGKSGVAIELAKKYDGEIISADSRQIYIGMDLGTGKVEGQVQAFNFQISGNTRSKNIYVSEGIPHHLIDIIDPMTPYNVSHFKKDAQASLEDIVRRGKLPIICGGTAFWIDSLIYNAAFPDAEPNPELRAALETQTTESLFKTLSEKDPERALTIDPHNKVRLIRALEIIESLGLVPAAILTKDDRYDFLIVGIATDREALNAKIKERLDQRFTEGMIEEVQQLNAQGVSWEWMEKIGLEYRWISRYLQEKVSLEEMKEKLYFDIIHYAKRQMTWLKRNPDIVWLETFSEIQETVKNFLRK